MLRHFPCAAATCSLDLLNSPLFKSAMHETLAARSNVFVKSLSPYLKSTLQKQPQQGALCWRVLHSLPQSGIASEAVSKG